MTCPVCNGARQVMWQSGGDAYADQCPACLPKTWAPPGPGRVHPLASIGDPPEHRDYISGKLGPALPPEIGRDCVISAFVTVDCGLFEPTRIGDRCLLMTKCHVGHDAQIGDDVELGASSVICGHVVVGDGAKVHGLAFVRPGIRIGAGARIGGGAVVTKDVPAGEVWAGVPATRLTRGRVARENGARLAEQDEVREDYAERCQASRESWRRFL